MRIASTFLIIAHAMPAAIAASRRAEIIEAVAAGLKRGTPLTVICEALQAQGRFSQQSTYNWLKSDPEAKVAIEYARDLGFDWLAHECLQIIDSVEPVAFDAEGRPWPNGAAVLKARAQVETRLKLLAKWDPRRYGELKRVEVDAEVRTTTRHVIDPRTLPPELEQSLRALVEHAKAQGLLESPGPIDAEFEELGPQEDVADG